MFVFVCPCIQTGPFGGAGAGLSPVPESPPKESVTQQQASQEESQDMKED